ncbi:mechanosensitive ion channel [Marinococcus halophilus]|uniref:mechanosensitive ion channel n=1 Tax=Marinococcus halophilus TaxID=1371 RepID=UPI0009A70B50|nr:mechanosensitive ion channel [Marinococcus halophilus]
MNAWQNSLTNFLNQIANAIPGIIAALLLLVVAWIVAKVGSIVIRKLVQKSGLERRLSSKTEERSSKNEGPAASVGKAAYYLIFILFLPGILDALGMASVSEPISNMMDKLLGFLPNILAAAIIIVVGYFVARFVRDLIAGLLNSLQLDQRFRRIMKQPENADDNVSLSSLLANILFVLILLPIITTGIDALQIEAVSAPVSNMLNMILAAIPTIAVALILLAIGYLIAKVVVDLLYSLLKNAGVNSLYRKYIGETSNAVTQVDAANIISQTVRVLILLFFVVEALNTLQFEVLNQIGNTILGYLPLAFSALIIFGLAAIGGRLIASMIQRTTNSAVSGLIVKYVIWVVAGFMIFDQLQFASMIVNTAFLLILGGLSVAFAISFGIGGRGFAQRQLEKWEIKMKKDQSGE